MVILSPLPSVTSVALCSAGSVPPHPSPALCCCGCTRVRWCRYRCACRLTLPPRYQTASTRHGHGCARGGAAKRHVCGGSTRLRSVRPTLNKKANVCVCVEGEALVFQIFLLWLFGGCCYCRSLIFLWAPRISATAGDPVFAEGRRSGVIDGKGRCCPTCGLCWSGRTDYSSTSTADPTRLCVAAR